MVGLAWLMSSHKKRVDWRLVSFGLLLQLVLAAILFQSQNWTFNGHYPNGILFAGVEAFFGSINSYVAEGSGFMFPRNGIGAGDATDPMVLVKTFAFGVLPTVIFFAALMSILYHIGLMQILIRGMAWVMQKTLRTSGAESLAAAANVLVGHTEAPLVVKPYVQNMTAQRAECLDGRRIFHNQRQLDGHLCDGRDQRRTLADSIDHFGTGCPGDREGLATGS